LSIGTLSGSIENPPIDDPNNPHFSTHSLPPLIRNYLGDTQKKKKLEIINFNEFSFSFSLGYIEELNHLEFLFYFINLFFHLLSQH
jgi:hypothetical protein